MNIMKKFFAIGSCLLIAACVGEEDIPRTPSAYREFTSNLGGIYKSLNVVQTVKFSKSQGDVSNVLTAYFNRCFNGKTSSIWDPYAKHRYLSSYKVGTFSEGGSKSIWVKENQVSAQNVYGHTGDDAYYYKALADVFTDPSGSRVDFYGDKNMVNLMTDVVNGERTKCTFQDS